MKARQWAVVGLAAGILVASMETACARPRIRRRARRKQKAKVNTRWEAKADRNKDGVVQPVEARKAKTGTYLKKRSTVNRPWEAKADTNNDGKVSASELRTYHTTVIDKNGDGKIDAKERKGFWVHRKSKVNTAVEKKYDADGNGWISGDEAQELLRDRLRVINTNGRAKVDSAIEAEYDADGDGVIDKKEAEAIKDALGIG